jgi:hypothetical protein
MTAKGLLPDGYGKNEVLVFLDQACPRVLVAFAAFTNQPFHKVLESRIAGLKFASFFLAPTTTQSSDR